MVTGPLGNWRTLMPLTPTLTMLPAIKTAAEKRAAEQNRTLTQYLEWLILRDTALKKILQDTALKKK
jgi:hypothetical protein